MRCNFQIEGSGPSPDDVIIDGGGKYEGKGIEARPEALKKHVILRVDRADGFVARNLLVRGALEHGLYIEEADGYRLERVKFFWAADYGNLTFTSDHGLYKNCDGFGSGDSVVYPGAAPETGSQATDFYPDAPRFNTTVKKCDMRGSALAYSGSMGNSVRITRNNVYGNGSGLSTDTISAAGHPGFPADSVQIDHNLIYSNNLNLFTDDPPVVPVVGVPVGVGILWPGHNDGRVFDNWIFDNWRRGTMLLSIPDGSSVNPASEGNVNPGISCPTAPDVTTSCNNHYFDNHMGQAPPDFTKRAWNGLRFGTPHGDLADRSLPNGVDFWWDEWSGNTGNCWFDNTGSDGTAASVTGPGAGSPPEVLPSDCATSNGGGDVAKTVVLLDCSMWERGQTAADRPTCDWFSSPPEPGTAAARRENARTERELDGLPAHGRGPADARAPGRLCEPGCGDGPRASRQGRGHRLGGQRPLRSGAARPADHGLGREARPVQRLARRRPGAPDGDGLRRALADQPRRRNRRDPGAHRRRGLRALPERLLSRLRARLPALQDLRPRDRLRLPRPPVDSARAGRFPGSGKRPDHPPEGASRAPAGGL